MLGTHLCRQLAGRGMDILALDLVGDDGVAAPNVTHLTGDVRDDVLVKRLAAAADAIVHCAAALPSYSPRDIWSIDVEGTRVVTQAAAAAGVRRLIHVSSTAVYGLPGLVPTPDNYRRAPIDHYGRAKAEAEMICESAREQGLTVTILRPKTFLGPERLGLFAMLFEWADEGLNFPLLGGGNVLCQMLDVADLVDVISDALTRPQADLNGAFNIAATDFGTLREDFQAVLDAAGRGGRIIGIPAAPALPVLRVLELARISPVYKRLMLKLLADSCVDVSQAQQRLGFQPRYSNRDSLLRTYDWWKRTRDSRPTQAPGLTHRSPWRQGALQLAKAFC